MAFSWVLALVIAAGAVSGKQSSERIVGGEPTTIDRYPSIVQVDFNQLSWYQGCTGTILTSRYVLSAAHCYHGLSFWGIDYRRIRVGSTYRNTGGILHRLSAIHNHPTFRNETRFDADISVLGLFTPITFNQVAQPGIIINQGVSLPDNTPVVHAGWGNTEYGGTPSDQLLHATVYTINNDLCRERYLNGTPIVGGIVTENMICAGILDVGGKGPCQGDSGGPVYYGDIVVGVVSWSYSCADGYWPSVSTNVAAYTDWIVDTAV